MKAYELTLPYWQKYKKKQPEILTTNNLNYLMSLFVFYLTNLYICTEKPPTPKGEERS